MRTVEQAAVVMDAVHDKLFPSDPSAMSDPATAMRYLHKAISICGETPAILLLQSQALLQQKEYDAAAKIATYAPPPPPPPPID